MSVAAFEIEFDSRSADLVITAFERGGLNVNLAEAIRRDEGYGLVFEHAALSEVPPRRTNVVTAEFLAALNDVAEGGSDPRFHLLQARASRVTYRETLRAFRRAERRARIDVEYRLKEMLPAGADFSSTAYLVVGGDSWGIAFSDREDIAIRLDDFVPAETGADPDLSALSALLCHELFHVGFRAAGGLPPWPRAAGDDWWRLVQTWGPNVVGEVWRASDEPWRPAAMEARLDAWLRPATWEWQALDRYLAMLSRLQNEGTAVYVEAPLRGRAAQAELTSWMSTIDDDFAFLEKLTERLNHGADADEIDRLAAEGFRNNGPLYRVGYRVAERIDGFNGRSALLRTMENGVLEFFDSYFETHPYGPGQMKSGTEEDVRKVIREIRGVGRFDPEAG